MKRFFLLSFCFLLSISLFAQHTEFQKLILPNGMEVVLCEDHSQPQIYGAVCVHVGAKNDPEENTGMAHYLEHLMFKGTDKIGTTNWAAERDFLEEITNLYDEAHPLPEGETKNNILMRINELSNKATEYAIPNEVDVILSKMGGEGVNAFTSNDVTCYHNSFPSNQLEKWLMVYTERFRNPIFRLFQSELEAVYEEYNMYQDQPMSVFLEDALAAAYGDHPYGRPVIGYQKHLKNPQISAMRKFFNTYYQPNNMTLVLVGDFNAQNIQPLLESTIGHLKNESEGAIFNQNRLLDRMNTDLNQAVTPFKGHQIQTVSETPVKVGVVGYQTVGSHSTKSVYFDIISGLLNNEAGTGLLDQLTNEQKVLAAQGFDYSMLENGMFAFMYVPKILGQSHEDAEKFIFAAIDSLRTGHFSDNLFNAVKMEYLKDFIQIMESLEGKFYTTLDIVTNKQNPDEYLYREDVIRSMTKQDIMNTANIYFTDNCLIFRSNMGIKAKEKLQKPNWKPIVAQNTDAKSKFAESIESMPVEDILPQTIEFGKDVVETNINDNFTLYSARNPYNDIFSLSIRYNYGSLRNRDLENAIDYFALQGTDKLSYSEFQTQLQLMGASMNVYAYADELRINLSGFEQNLGKIIQLCYEKFMHPGNDEKKFENLIEGKKTDNKMKRSDASTWGRALFNYALYGNQSPYLTNPTLKEMKKYTGQYLLDVLKQALAYDGSVLYVGNTDPKEVVELLQNQMISPTTIKKGTKALSPLRDFPEPTVLLVSNKDFLQSNIYFYTIGNQMENIEDKVACEAYNEYMGGSMAGVIFQEIRELRSLGYSAYGAYSYDWLNRRPGFQYGFLGTQSDKTIEGCTAMSELLTQLPQKFDKFNMAKNSALKKSEADYVSFRDLPSEVKSWKEQGYTSDPRKEMAGILENLSFDDMQSFFNNHIADHPIVITIAGDKNRIDIKSLEKNYKVIEVKYKDIIKE